MPRLTDPTQSLVASGAPAGGGVGLGLDPGYTSTCQMARVELIRRVHEEGLVFTARQGWDTWEPASVVEKGMSEIDATLMMRDGLGGSHAYGYESTKGDWYAALDIMPGWWSANVAAKSDKALKAAMKFLDTLAGPPRPLGNDEVSMSVWSEHPMGGGQERYATMKVGVWGDVADNYPSTTRAALEGLAERLPEKGQGGLVVLCGHAGTGKTRAIEALAAAWAAEARLGVVVDSDRLLGSASYLADVLVAAGDRRQVIVAEDVDELVVTGPKSHETSKLLNIADGIVGRLAGAGTLFVLTANLPQAEIASYVTRKGRAAATVEFELFDHESANQWLETRKAEARVEPKEEGGYSLADLYGMLPVVA